MTAVEQAREVSAEERDIDPDGVIGEMIDAGRTLPSDWYTSDQIFEAEQRRIFRRSWQFVGHGGQVASPGDYFTCEVGGVPIVVVRGKDAELRAFVNICRHRHNAVALGEGNKQLFMCGYHAWTYKLDGSFNAAPRSREDPTFDGCTLSLTPAAVECLGDMVFVNVSGDAPPLLEALGPIPDLARGKGIPLDHAKFHEMRSVELEANWKIPWDNNVECYHCPTVHNSWNQTAKLDPKHVYSYPVGPLQFEHHIDVHDTAVTGLNVDYTYYSWPTVCLSTDSGTGAQYDARAHSLEAAGEPGVASASAHATYFMWRFVPLSPRRTRIEWHLFSVAVVDQASLDEVFEGLISVLTEDKVICESVQRSHESGAGPLGTLIPALDSEFITLTWEKLVHRALTQPATGLYEAMLTPTSTWPQTESGA